MEARFRLLFYFYFIPRFELLKADRDWIYMSFHSRVPGRDAGAPTDVRQLRKYLALLASEREFVRLKSRKNGKLQAAHFSPLTHTSQEAAYSWLS